MDSTVTTPYLAQATASISSLACLQSSNLLAHADLRSIKAGSSSSSKASCRPYERIIHIYSLQCFVKQFKSTILPPFCRLEYRSDLAENVWPLLLGNVQQLLVQKSLMFPLPYQYMLVQWNLREEKQHNQNEFIAWPSSSTLSCKSQIRTSTPTSTLGSNQLLSRQTFDT